MWKEKEFNASSKKCGQIRSRMLLVPVALRLSLTRSSRIAYDVQDPEPDEAGRQDLHKATATDLIPIPKTGSHLPTFGVGKHVLARYPDTTTLS